MTHASVFSGIGGPEVAASMLGWENLFHCEINPFGKRVLDYWYPNAESYDDITTTDFTKWRGRVDVFTGGFPCQPFSYAGQRKGAEDDRYLWPSMYRAIDEIQPTWVVAENVAGILTMVEQGEVSKVASPPSLFAEINDIRGQYQLRETFTLQRICTDLEGHGYAVQPILIPACAVGAPHRRDRVFIVARRLTSDTCSGGQSAPEQQGKRERTAVQQQSREQSFDGIGRPSDARTTTDTERERLPQSEHFGQSRFREGLSEGSGGRYVEERTSSADSACGREGTPRPSDCPEGSRGGQNQQPSEWRATPEWSDRFYAILRPLAYTDNRHLQERRNIGSGMGEENRGRQTGGRCDGGLQEIQGSGFVGCGERWEGFPTVSPVHRGNDGIPFPVDGLTISFGKWRTEALRAYGNAIVPQVMYEVFKAIEQVEPHKTTKSCLRK